MGAFGKPGTFAPRKDSPWLLDLGHCALSEGVPWRLTPCPPGADGPFAVRALCVCVRVHALCVCVRVRACPRTHAGLPSSSHCPHVSQTWRCRCFRPRHCFILEEKLSLVCSLYL